MEIFGLIPLFFLGRWLFRVYKNYDYSQINADPRPKENEDAAKLRQLLLSFPHPHPSFSARHLPNPETESLNRYEGRHETAQYEEKILGGGPFMAFEYRDKEVSETLPAFHEANEICIWVATDKRLFLLTKPVLSKQWMSERRRLEMNPGGIERLRTDWFGHMYSGWNGFCRWPLYLSYIEPEFGYVSYGPRDAVRVRFKWERRPEKQSWLYMTPSEATALIKAFREQKFGNQHPTWSKEAEAIRYLRASGDINEWVENAVINLVIYEMNLRQIKEGLSDTFMHHPELLEQDVSYWARELAAGINHWVADCVTTIWLSNPELLDELTAAYQLVSRPQLVTRLTEIFLPFTCLDQSEMNVSLEEVAHTAAQRLLKGPPSPKGRIDKWIFEDKDLDFKWFQD